MRNRNQWACAAIAVLASAAFADAAQAASYNLTAGAQVTKGKAHAKGTVTFPAAKRVKVSGTVNDICPADGYGAYIEFKVNFVGGGYATSVYRDTDKCKAKANKYAFNRAFPKRVKSVGVTLIEIDADTDKVGDAARKLIRR